MSLEDQMSLDVEVYTCPQNQGKLEAGHIRWLEEVKERLQKLRSSKLYRDTHIKRLCSWGRMSIGRPQRRSNLTVDQGFLGWKVTMQS